MGTFVVIFMHVYFGWMTNIVSNYQCFIIFVASIWLNIWFLLLMVLKYFCTKNVYFCYSYFLFFLNIFLFYFYFEWHFCINHIYLFIFKCLFKWTLLFIKDALRATWKNVTNPKLLIGSVVHVVNFSFLTILLIIEEYMSKYGFSVCLSVFSLSFCHISRWNFTKLVSL